MPVEIGEAREKMGRDVWQQAEDHASKLKDDKDPFYIVYAAKQDKKSPNIFRQTFKFYRQRPPKIIGLLVWYVDNANGIFQFVPELSVPPDVPLDPSLLSKKSEDQLTGVMEQGEKMNVLLA